MLQRLPIAGNNSENVLNEIFRINQKKSLKKYTIT